MIGLRELAMVAVAVGVIRSIGRREKPPGSRRVLPWLSPQRRKGGRPGTVNAPSPSERHRPWPRHPKARTESKRFFLRGNRLFWFLTILAATAVAAWIVTRVMIASGAGHRSHALRGAANECIRSARPLRSQAASEITLTLRSLSMMPFAFLPKSGHDRADHHRLRFPADFRQPPAERHAVAGQERDRVQERHLGYRGRDRPGGDPRQETDPAQSVIA